MKLMHVCFLNSKQYFQSHSFSEIKQTLISSLSLGYKCSKQLLSLSWKYVKTYYYDSFLYPTKIGKVGKCQVMEYQLDGHVYELYSKFDKRLGIKMLNSKVEYIESTNSNGESHRTLLRLQPGVVPTFTASDLGTGRIEITNLFKESVCQFKDDEPLVFS